MTSINDSSCGSLSKPLGFGSKLTVQHSVYSAVLCYDLQLAQAANFVNAVEMSIIGKQLKCY